MNFVARIIFLSLIVITFSKCSQENYSLVNRTFHNTTAHYNSYFLAREKMKAVDSKIWEANADDYTRVLKIFPEIDTNVRNTIAPDLEEIIKKAALPVTKHKNSNWVDDSYILIGKTRLYQSQIPLALETFKYVNTKGADINSRHLALIYLMRTFILIKDFDNSNAVFNYLKKEKLEKSNSVNFFLTRSHHYIALEDFKTAEAYLTLAVKDIRKKEYRGRIHFIIAQINQQFGNDEEAFINYNKVLKNNPSYELSFYSKLFRTQVSQFNNTSDRKKVEKYFKKLLADRKNVEYKDKIYYEMGMFELKQGNLKPSISYFEKSLLEKSKNINQKATTFLTLGKIYYEKLRNYEQAKQYYDSTVATWNPSSKEFRIISIRQKVLEEFVTYLRIVQREDSLQKLAAMDTATLSNFLDNLVLENERKNKEALKKQEEAAAKAERIKFNSANNGGTVATNNLDRNVSSQTWYFDNPNVLSSGKSEFIKRWGTRTLEDNWRRSVKEKNNDVSSVGTASETQDTSKAPVVIEKSEAVLRKEAKELLNNDIPRTPELLAASNKKLEPSLYNLGKIYNLKLEEPDNAINSFQDYLKKFTETERTPEVLYFLYLIFQSKNKIAESDGYKNRILKEYPTTIYAKLILNPNYLEESKIANKQAAQLYKVAYEQYEYRNFLTSDSLINVLKSSHPGNNISDKVSLLEILIVGQTKSPIIYRTSLENFIKDYKTSNLVPLAKEYLNSAQEFIGGKTKSGITLDSNALRYDGNIEGLQYLGVLFRDDQPSEEVIREIYNFSNTNYQNIAMQTEVMDLPDSTYVIMIKEFPEINDAKRFQIAIKHQPALLNLNLLNSFVISKTNTSLLKKSKNIQDYMKFYFEKYQ